jgi:DNA-binding CsgD family transcriptional regulator
MANRVQMVDGQGANALVEGFPSESLMHPLLSARQEQCLRLTAFRTDKEIAAHLGISEATVKKHVHEACQRLGVNRRKAGLALLDPVVPDSSEKAPVRSTAGYPKQPMAPSGGSDHASDEREAGLTSGDQEAPGAARTDQNFGRLGYRVPPGSPVLRVVLIVVLTIILAVLVVTLVVMLGDLHEAVGKIDAASAAA